MVNSKNYDYYCSQIDNVVREMEEDITTFLNENDNSFTPIEIIMVNGLNLRRVFKNKDEHTIYVELNCGETQRLIDCSTDEMLEIYFEMTKN